MARFTNSTDSISQRFRKGDVVLISPCIDYHKKLYNRDSECRENYSNVPNHLYKIDWIYPDRDNIYCGDYYIYRLCDMIVGTTVEWYYESDLMFPFIND